jgi:peptidyl-prolyl cis-trans isomerase A (cyclophilin A)
VATRTLSSGTIDLEETVRLPTAPRCSPLLVLLLPLITGGRLAAQDPLPSEAPLRDGEVAVFMRTTLGDLQIAVDTLRAPTTGRNFLRYVDAGLYVGGTFYRVVRDDNQPDDSVRIDVIQGGMDRARRRQAFEPIPLESTEVTGLRHRDGTLSMARSGPNSATAEFFITLGPQPALDAGGARNPDGLGFAAFGRIVDGMDVVRALHALPTEGQYLVDRIAIRFVERIGPRTLR